MDPIQQQIAIVTPHLKELQSVSYFKKHPEDQTKLKECIDSLQYQDMDQVNSNLTYFLSINNKQIKFICLKTLTELFTAENLEYFLASNYAQSILNNLLPLLVEPKPTLFSEAIECLRGFLLSPNQQLYIHFNELSDVITTVMSVFNSDPNIEHRQAAQTLLKVFIFNFTVQLEKDKNEILTEDIRIVISSLIKCILQGLSDDAVKFSIEMIELLVFDSQSHPKLLLVELPELFIHYALKAPSSIFPQISSLFHRYVLLGDSVLPTFPAIIDKLITPAFENPSTSSPRALSLLKMFTEKRPDLLSVFVMSDCSTTETRRVFECLNQNLIKYINEVPQNMDLSIDVLTSILISFRNFYLTTISATEESGEFNNQPRSEEEAPEQKNQHHKEEISSISGQKKILEEKMTNDSFAESFNEKPKEGLKLALKYGLCKDTPEEIGPFLRNCQLLSPEKVGEFISQQNNSQILNSYIKTFDFSKLELDVALRMLCAAFRLPGEAQMIDRIMEAFAHHYHEQNPSISADAVYVVSFSIIMLHTDIHNPSIKHKITCDEWIRNTRNCQEANEVTDEQMKEIYDRVVAKPMKLKGGALSPTAETDELRKRCHKQLKAIASSPSPIPKLSRELLLLAIDRLWASIFATLSNTLQNCANIATASNMKENIVLQSLDTIKIALTAVEHLFFFLSHYHMQKEVLSVVSFLCTYQPPTEQLQLSLISTLIRLATDNGPGIGDAWVPLLQFFSTLIRPLSVKDTQMEPVDPSIPNSLVINEKDKKKLQFLKEDAIPLDQIDCVYRSSSKLGRFSIIAYLKALCEISLKEIFDNPPSLHGLQKLIESAELNLGRPRFVWANAWHLIASHFTRIGCIAHEGIAIYAVNGLKQIVSCITHDEEKWKHFQRETLNPFIIIFLNQNLQGPRKFVIQCITSLFSDGMNAESGWEVLLDLFETAALDDDSEIVMSAYNLLVSCLDKIPSQHNYKLLLTLANFTLTKVVPKININAASFMMSIGLKAEATQSLLLVISNTFNHTNSEVVTITCQLYSVLLQQYITDKLAKQSEELIEKEWKRIETEMILPLFATPNLHIQQQLIREICQNLIPKIPIMTSLIAPMTANLLVDANFEIIKCLCTSFLILLPNLPENYNHIVQKALFTVIQNNLSTLQLIDNILDSIPQEKVYFGPCDACLQKAMSLSSPKHIIKALNLMYSILAKNPDDKVDSIKTAEATLMALMLSSIGAMGDEKDVITVIETIQNGCNLCSYSFLKEKRFEFQSALFEFYKCESSQVRSLIRELAIDSQIIFR